MCSSKKFYNHVKQLYYCIVNLIILQNHIKMKKLKISIVLMIFLTFGSCIPSLFPLYHATDLITDQNLIGSWKEDGSLNTWVFYRNDNKKFYTLRFLEKSNNNIDDATPGILGIFELNLFKLGDETFLDFYPGENEILDEGINSLMEFHLLPVHTFAKIEISKDTLLIYQFDVTHLEDLLDEGKIRIRHETRDKDLVLTAKTDELQEFFIKYSKEEDVFFDPIILIKNN